MTCLRAKSAVVAVVACAALGSVGVPIVNASPLGEDHASLTAQVQLYSDPDIVALLVLGVGRAAKDHPELAKKFATKTTTGVPAPTAQQISSLTNALIGVVPNFHQTVTLGVQRHDPFAAQAAMTALGQGLHVIANRVHGGATPAPLVASPDGWVWHDANIITEVNAVGAINAVGYANAAVVTAVAWVLYVTPGAVSYEFPTTPNSLDSENTVAQLATTLPARVTAHE